MARKSSAALAILSPLRERPQPPSDLTQDEGEVWRAIVSTKPPEWFSADTYPLLVAYCRTTIRARVVAKMIEDAVKQIGEGPGVAGVYEKLFDMEGKLSRTLCTLATKMRLSQQSKYGARGAEGVARRAGENPVKPWQLAGNDSNR